MEKFNKLALVVASATIALAGCATSTPTQVNDNWGNGNAEKVWRSGDGELCWQNPFWTEGTAAVECGRPAEAAPQAPAATTQKVSYSADTFFDFDKYVLKPAGKAALDELITRMGGMKTVEVIVATGHTDSIGTEAYNQKLSERRAEAVKAYLVQRGVPSDLVYVEGKGETQPIADNRTREGRAQNRRVEIEVVGYVQK